MYIIIWGSFICVNLLWYIFCNLIHYVINKVVVAQHYLTYRIASRSKKIRMKIKFVFRRKINIKIYLIFFRDVLWHFLVVNLGNIFVIRANTIIAKQLHKTAMSYNGLPYFYIKFWFKSLYIAKLNFYFTTEYKTTFQQSNIFFPLEANLCTSHAIHFTKTDSKLH